jgi:hypothetical protein
MQNRLPAAINQLQLELGDIAVLSRIVDVGNAERAGLLHEQALPRGRIDPEPALCQRVGQSGEHLWTALFIDHFGAQRHREARPPNQRILRLGPTNAPA